MSKDTLCNKATEVLHEPTAADGRRGYWLATFVKQEGDVMCDIFTSHIADDQMVEAMVREILDDPSFIAVREAIKQRLLADTLIGQPVGSA